MNKMFWQLFFLVPLSLGVLSGPALGQTDRRPPRPMPPIIGPGIVLQDPALIPIRLDAVKIDAQVHGNEAITRLELVFFNPNPRVLEGELQFPLLAGQQVVGMAMDVRGALREAVPVEEAKGQEVFEDVIRQKVDPALLEVTQGNNYKLRVYPLEAKSSKRVVLHLLETLPVREKEILFRLPVSYASKLPQLDLILKVFGSQTKPKAVGGVLGNVLFARKGEVYEATVRREHFSTQGSVLEVRVPVPERATVSTQTYEDKTYFRAEFPVPPVKPVKRQLPGKVALYWDASGSGAQRDKAQELALLGHYFKAMEQGTVDLIVFRDTPEKPQTFQVTAGDWAALKKHLESLPYDGATSFTGLTLPPGSQEALFFSDGLENLGAQSLPDFGVPVFAVSSAVSADIEPLRQMTERSGGRLIDLKRLTEAEAQQRLLMSVTELSELSGDGHVSELLAESRWAEDGRFLIAGVVSAQGGTVKAAVTQPGKKTPMTVEVIVPPVAVSGGSLAALTWARFKLAELDAQYGLKRAEIRRLGQLFRVPTRETSLIILDAPEDYARHDIDPPAELAAEVATLRSQMRQVRTREETEHLERIVRQFQEKAAWWNKDFPKDAPPKPSVDEKVLGGVEQRLSGAQPRPAVSAPPPGSARHAMPMARVAAAPAPPNQDAAPTKNEPTAQAGIVLKKWTSDAPYIARLQAADVEQLYAVYLDERPSWQDSSAFYLDVADTLFDKGKPELAVRVLTNLAEMNLENRALLRILAYRLMQAKQAKLAILVFEKVRQLAPNEPQSHRDLGLAYAADAQWQKAVDSLWTVVSRPWHNRFPDVESIALAELNAILATAPVPVDSSRIDPRLKKNLPLDLRVTLTWDTDNSDMDLWVTDPNGEKSYYGNKVSYQGGRMSADVTQGYGPEEYSLKVAKPGKYLVQANFYGHSQQVLSAASTLQVRLQTKFGMSEGKEEIMTLRLKGAKDVVTMGTFEVPANK